LSIYAAYYHLTSFLYILTFLPYCTHFLFGLIVRVCNCYLFFILKTKTCTTISHAPQKANVTEAGNGHCLFAPGRIKEHFKIDVEGRELKISYTPPEGFPRPDWIQREYSRGGFLRSFVLDESMDTENITAKYVDGVLQIGIPLVQGKETTKQEIKIK
jgi:HSP20 family protein